DGGREEVGREIRGGREGGGRAGVLHRPRDGGRPLLQGEGPRRDRRRVHRFAERRIDRSGHGDASGGVGGVGGRDRRRALRAAGSGPVSKLHQLLPAAGERGEEHSYQETVVQGSHWRPPSFKMMKWTTNSTRRLATRPDSLELDWSGRDELNPLETSLSRATPWLATY